MSSVPVLQHKQPVNENAWKNPTFRDRLINYADLPMLWLLGLYSFLAVVTNHILTSPVSLLDITKLKDEAFAKTWLTMNAVPGDPTQTPTHNIVPMLATATGVVLELGPGSGEQLRLLTNPGIKAIYGVEPCKHLHGPLATKAEKAGLSDKYHILACGGEKGSLYPALEAEGLFQGKEGEGVFDTIISSKVLCSIPNGKATVEGLYGLLKPGGRILVCEHVRNPWNEAKGSIFARSLQALLMWLGWSFLLGGCCLDKDSLNVLRDVAKVDGGWETDSMEVLVPWGVLPWALGELKKRS